MFSLARDACLGPLSLVVLVQLDWGGVGVPLAESRPAPSADEPGLRLVQQGGGQSGPGRGGPAGRQLYIDIQ